MSVNEKDLNMNTFQPEGQSKPQPPTLEEVVASLPEDFLQDYPYTDRLMQAIESWKVSVQFNREYDRIQNMIMTDFITALNVLDVAKDKITDENVANDAKAIVERFKDGIGKSRTPQS